MSWEAPPTLWDRFIDFIEVSVPVSLIVVLVVACWHYWEGRIDGKPEQVGKKGSAGRRREQSTKEPS
jgi:hypothetical protein